MIARPRLPAAGSLPATLAGLGLLALFPAVVREGWVLNIGFFVLMYAALATSWNLMAGYVGYFSMATVGFFGMGAYGTWILTDRFDVDSSAGVLGLIPVVAVLVALASLPVAAVAYRARSSVFILMTLTMVLMAEYLAFNLVSITGGSRGASLPRATFAPEMYQTAFYLAMFGVLAAGILICWYLRSSVMGLSLFAIRDDEDKAAGLGVLTTWPKYLAFALAAFVAAGAGGVWSFRIGYIYPHSAFDMGALLLGSILMALLGGLGTLWGPTLGALILVPVEQTLAYELGSARLYLLTYVLVFVGVVLALPRGIIPTTRDWIDRRRRSRTEVDDRGTSQQQADDEAVARAVGAVGAHR